MQKDESGNVVVSELGIPIRYVTSHDAQGEPVFSSMLGDEISPLVLPGALLYDLFVGTQHPANLTDDADLKANNELPPPTSLTREGCTTFRIVDFLPGGPIVMHRTVTIDFFVVLEGELELNFPSGEKKLLNRGEVVIQRGTSHAWRNPHPTNTARILCTMMPIQPLVVNGVELGDFMDLSGGADAS